MTSTMIFWLKICTAYHRHKIRLIKPILISCLRQTEKFKIWRGRHIRSKVTPQLFKAKLPRIRYAYFRYEIKSQVSSGRTPYAKPTMRLILVTQRNSIIIFLLPLSIDSRFILHQRYFRWPFLWNFNNFIL